MDKILEVENLAFGYGPSPLFSGIEFSVRAGDFVAVTGANGAGKSTLLRLLLRELQADQGEIRLFGQKIGKFRDWQKVGYVPQNSGAMADFPANAAEIVAANLSGEIGLFRFTQREHRQRVMAALAEVGLEAQAGKMFGRLSGGQQQRVRIAKVLVSRPSLMLLDEPATGIDGETVLALYTLLGRLNRETGLTILMVTHDPARVSRFCHRTFCLEEGSLVELDREQVAWEIGHRHKHPPRPMREEKGGCHRGDL